MKIIFLDIDGVLNHCHLETPFKRYDGTIANPVKGTPDLNFHRGMDFDKIEHLNYILDSLPDWKIVISSAWGYHGTDDCTTKDFFIHFGFKHIHKIIGETDKCFYGRGLQILEWVDGNQVEDFITIEDEPFDINGTHDSVTEAIRTRFEGKVYQPYCDIGLTRELAETIIKELKEKK